MSTELAPPEQVNLLQLFVRVLVSCSHCGDPAELGSFPLCFPCHWILESARPQPIELGSPIDSALALYSLNDESYAVLRSWKKRPGLLFDRIVLKNDFFPPMADFIEQQATPIECIVPIPQSIDRYLKMRGSTTSRMAQWLGQGLKLPICELLKTSPFSFKKRQAELDYWERQLNPIDLRMRFHRKPPRAVLLVDDFITTGHTLRQAAEILKQGGVRQVSVLGVGARGTLRCRSTELSSEKELQLLEGA